MTDHFALRAYVIVLITYFAACDHNLKTKIFWFDLVFNQVYFVSALEKDLEHFIKFARDGQIKVQSEVSVIASKRKIIGVTLCATKVKENAADFNILFNANFLQHSKKVKSNLLRL